MKIKLLSGLLVGFVTLYGVSASALEVENLMIQLGKVVIDGKELNSNNMGDNERRDVSLGYQVLLNSSQANLVGENSHTQNLKMPPLYMRVHFSKNREMYLCREQDLPFPEGSYKKLSLDVTVNTQNMQNIGGMNLVQCKYDLKPAVMSLKEASIEKVKELKKEAQRTNQPYPNQENEKLLPKNLQEQINQN